MKLKHNKKRNTAFVYEILINEVSKASMHGLQEKKEQALNILKAFFCKGAPLREELEIYKSFEELEELDNSMIEKIISEARAYASRLNSDVIYESQTKLIDVINRKLGAESWNSFIRDYKKIATINQVVFNKTNPKKQVFVEKKLLEILTKKEILEKKPFPNVNNLALKTFLQKFNSEYSDTLNENQKTLLNKYVSSYKDEGLELKLFLYGEIDRLREELEKQIDNSVEDSKLNLVLEKINGYQNKKVDRKLITEVIKIQSLVGEFSNGN
jgi:hypothetical protein|tara:strand:- start:110 stop:919 length:810 start_codon:yes stop_codon:yes gene_type:complete